MYIKISYKLQGIPDTQSRLIAKVNNFLGQPSYVSDLFYIKCLIFVYLIFYQKMNILMTSNVYLAVDGGRKIVLVVLPGLLK